MAHKFVGWPFLDISTDVKRNKPWQLKKYSLKNHEIKVFDEYVFSIGVDYGTSVLTPCFLSHLPVHYCYVIPVKYA